MRRLPPGPLRRRFTRHAVVLAALAVAALVSGCGGSDEPSKVSAASKPPRTSDVALPGGRIVFRRYLDVGRTQGALFTVNPDGSQEKQVTESEPSHVDDHPDWSPDGKRIAFERCAELEPCRVFTVAADGGRLREVKGRCELGPTCAVSGPAWTPEGRLLVSLAQGRERQDPGTGDRWDQESSIELLDLDTGRQRTVVKRSGWTGRAEAPAISPDGRTVLYMRWNSWRSKPAEGQGMYVVGIDGSDHHRLTPWRLGGGDHPGFAPDGTILFRSYEQEESKQSDYWTVRSDGTGLKQLTHFKDGTLVLSTSYSPDGDWIVHATNGVDGNADVFVMRADGSDDRPVTRSKLWDSAPDWGPQS